MAYTAYRSHVEEISTLNPYKPIPPIGSVTSESNERPQENSTRDEDDDEDDQTDWWQDCQAVLRKFTGDDGAVPTLEEILPDLQKIVRRLYRMSTKSDLPVEDVYVHLDCVYDLYYAFAGSRESLNAFGRHIAETKFVECVGNLFRYGVSQGVYENNNADSSVIRRCLGQTSALVWSLSDKSFDFCEKFISAGIHKDFFEYLGSEMFSPEHISDYLKQQTVSGFLGTLHNVVGLHKVSSAREEFRQCKAVEILQIFRECTKYWMISCLALMTQSYLVTEDENEKINSGTEVFEILIKLLQSSINQTDYNGLTTVPIEVLQTLNNLALNDSNKERIVDCGALPYYVILMSEDFTEIEHAEAAHGIWTLAFSEHCKEKILKEDGCLEALRSLLKTTENENVKKNAEGALWILTDEAKTMKNSEGELRESTESGHVFISYQWDSKTTILKIRDRLKTAGFKVWIDEDDMTGSVLEAMAMAVENAAVVIICMSQKYKDSANCRTEAEYTFKHRKPFVPLRLQQGYNPDGWLGALVGNKLFFDFSQATKYEDSVKRLIKELSHYKNAAYDVTDSVIPTNAPAIRVMPSSHEMSSQLNWWKIEDVSSWLGKNNLTHLKQLFVNCDGPTLRELQHMRQEVPDWFFSHLTKEGIGMIDQARLSRALRDLS